jgi:hypothetical protein
MSVILLFLAGVFISLFIFFAMTLIKGHLILNSSNHDGIRPTALVEENRGIHNSYKPLSRR